MEKLIQSYLDNSSFVGKDSKVKFINPDYKYRNTIIFTYSQGDSKHDKTAEINIWDLMVFVFNVAII